MFQVKHRIIIPNGGFEQSFGIVSGRWHNHLDARYVEEPRLRAERMKWAAFGAAAGGAANDQRRWYAAAPVKLARHVDNLVKTAGNEVDKLHLGDGAHTHDGRANRGTNDGSFRHRRINHTLRPELFQQAHVDFERASISANIFAEQENGLIAAHLFAHGLANRFQIGNSRHRVPTSWAS